MPANDSSAFISYSRQDSEFALRLAEDLKASGASVWLDQLDIQPGQEWDSAIEIALIQSPRVLIVLSPSSANSGNVRNEISFALDEKKIIIPVLYRDCAIPLQLRRLHYLDFTIDYALGFKALLNCLGFQPARPGPLDLSEKEMGMYTAPSISEPGEHQEQSNKRLGSQGPSTETDEAHRRSTADGHVQTNTELRENSKESKHIPRITALDDYPAAQGPEVLDDENTLSNGLKVRRSHFWKRISAGEIECGEIAEIALTRKTGITKTALKEASTALDISFDDLKETLGAKASISSGMRDESTTHYKKTLASPNCHGVRYAEWQFVDRFTLTILKKRWFGLLRPARVRSILDNHLSEFASDRFIYPSPRCCKEDYDRKLEKGFDRLRTISFPNITMLAMSKNEKDGTVSISGMDAPCRPGQYIPSERLAAYFNSIGEAIPREGGGVDVVDAGPARLLLERSRGLMARMMGGVDACPDISQLVRHVEGRTSEAEGDRVSDHLNTYNCRRCDVTAGFLRRLNGSARAELVRSSPIVLALNLHVGRDEDGALDDRENRRQLSRACLRVSLSEHRGNLVIKVQVWDLGLAGRNVEFLFLGNHPKRIRFPLENEAHSVLMGQCISKIHTEGWTASEERKIVLIRFVQPMAVRQLWRRAASLLRQRNNSEPLERLAVPGVAVSETGEVAMRAAVGGVVTSTQDSTIMINTPVDSDLHIGQSLHVYRDGVFLGVAVVLRSFPSKAACEFQAAGATSPLPGDLAMLPEHGAEEEGLE